MFNKGFIESIYHTKPNEMPPETPILMLCCPGNPVSICSGFFNKNLEFVILGLESKEITSDDSCGLMLTVHYDKIRSLYKGHIIFTAENCIGQEAAHLFEFMKSFENVTIYPSFKTNKHRKAEYEYIMGSAITFCSFCFDVCYFGNFKSEWMEQTVRYPEKPNDLCVVMMTTLYWGRNILIKGKK